MTFSGGNSAIHGEGGYSATLVILYVLGSQVSLHVLKIFSLLKRLPESE